MILTAGDSGALFDITGTVSNNATWDEYIYFLENGSGMNLDGLSFELQFRSNPTATDADLILSTADGELVLTDDDNSVTSIVRVNVAYTVISDLEGDYIADLVGKDVASKITHFAHGVVTFKQNPIAF